MQRVDANVILRYILEDNEVLFKKACPILEEVEVFIASEVIAEVVYVLVKVYQVSKKEICEVMSMLLTYENVTMLENEVMLNALMIFNETALDFVDCILCAYYKIKGDSIETFDRGILKYLEQVSKKP